MALNQIVHITLSRNFRVHGIQSNCIKTQIHEMGKGNKQTKLTKTVLIFVT